MFRGKKVIVIAPMYNEEGKIGDVVRSIPKGIVNKVLVVDDGSTDNGVEEATHYTTTILINDKNYGVGYSLRRGMKYALENNYDYIVHIEGGNQDDPLEIPKLLKRLDSGYDFVQGSRYLSVKSKIPLFRFITTKLFTKFFSFVVGKKITDAANGFRAYKTEVLKNINLEGDWLNGYALETYFLMNIIKNGFKYTEVPVKKFYKGNYSKMIPFKSWWEIVKPLVMK